MKRYILFKKTPAVHTRKCCFYTTSMVLPIFLLYLCICLPILYAQAPDTAWTRTYGGAGSDGGRTIHEASNGDLLIAGWTWSFGSGLADIYVLRTDAEGETLWTATLGSVFTDMFATILETRDSNIVVAYTRSIGSGNADVVLVKMDINGDTLWTQQYGSMTVDGCYGVMETADSGYILCGWTHSESAGGADVYVIKTTDNGDTLWTRRFGGEEDDFGYAINQTDNQEYIVCGYTQSYGAGEYDVYLLQLTEDGDTIWTRTYGGSEIDAGYGIARTADKGYLVVGETWSYGIGAPTYANVYAVRTDSLGDTVWTQTYGGEYNDGGLSIIPCAVDQYVIAGYTESSATQYDAYYLKIADAGDTIWTASYGGSQSERAFDVVMGTDHSYIFTGTTSSFGAGEYDLFLLKTAPDTLGIHELSHTNERRIHIHMSPNPFTSLTTIYLGTGRRAECINLKIYDISGRLVKSFSLLTETSFLPAVSWDGTDNQNRRLPSGVYFVCMETQDIKLVEKVVLLR
jgi:hypothetical protein